MNAIEEKSIDKEEDNDIIEMNSDIEDDIMGIFEKPDCAYPLEDIIEELKKLGYPNPGPIVLYAIQDELLYIDSIEDDGVVYLAIEDQEEGE